MPLILLFFNNYVYRFCVSPIYIIYHSYDADAKVTNISLFKPIGAAPAGFDDTLQREQVLEHKAALERYYSTE